MTSISFAPASTVTATSTSLVALSPTAAPTAANPLDLLGGLLGRLPLLGGNVLAKGPVGFDGVMFQTFFGGKAVDGYATPRDQTAYFAGMKVRVNT
jgi:hypothetical protein